MALPSYYTPVKPYKAPSVGGQTVQSQLYSALAAGNARVGTPPKVSDMIYGVEQADATNPSNTVYTPYQQAAPVAAVDPNTHQAPAAASSGSGGGGGGGFGLAGFEEDPILAKTRAVWARNVTQAEAAALAGRKQAEIGYGYDPNYTYADQPTQQAAQQNAFSDLANLLYQHTERAHNLDESLNKGNLFYSGERGVQLGREGRQYTLEQTQANQGFQSKLAAIGNALMQTRLQAQDAELQAQENAYNRALQFGLQYGTGFPSGGGGATPQWSSVSTGSLASNTGAGKPVSQLAIDATTRGGATFGLIRNSASLPGNMAPPGGGTAMYSADDPLAPQNVAASGGQAGVWAPVHEGESAQAFAQRVAQVAGSNPSSIMLDFEAESKGYPGTSGYQFTQDVYAELAKLGVNVPISATVPGGGEDDFNYAPIVQSGGMVWIQAYGADANTLFDPQARFNAMVARGVPPNQIGLMLMPGQKPIPGVAYSWYTLDDMPQATGAPAPPPPAVAPPPPPAPNVISTPPAQLYQQGYDPWAIAAIAKAQAKAVPNPALAKALDFSQWGRAI